MAPANRVRALASVAAVVAVAAQCGGRHAVGTSPNDQVCYRLRFGEWRLGDSTAFARGPAGLAHPLPDTIAVQGRVAARDTVFGKLRSTTGWSLVIRLGGRGATRTGSAWLAPSGPTDVTRPVPVAPLTAFTVRCSAGTLPLETGT